MNASPLLIGLMQRLGRHWFRARPRAYEAFTTAFDEVVEPDQLPALLPELSPDEQRSFDDAIARFDKLFTAERMEISAAGAGLVRDLKDGFTEEERAHTVVSFLIDHSGSMKGLRMTSALLAVEGAVDALDNAGIATEILGFTTASWHGGKSRLSWRVAGRPANPGRLCDLRHLVYGEASRTVRQPWHVRLALRPDMLHENVDGEALVWAASRLSSEKWQRRVICLVSDGAPIDDATLMANDDPDILVRHLAETQTRLTTEGFIVGTLLIGGERVPRPELFERAEEPQAAGVALIRLTRGALLASQMSKGFQSGSDPMGSIKQELWCSSASAKP